MFANVTGLVEELREAGVLANETQMRSAFREALEPACFRYAYHR